MSWVRVLKGHLVINTVEEDSEEFCRKKDAWPVEDYGIRKDQNDEV